MFQRDYPLQSLHSLSFRVYASYFAEINCKEEIPTLLERANKERLRVLMIGEGSNLLFRSNFQGLVLRMRIRGIELMKESHTHYYLRVGAGENWHQFVCYCLEERIYGLENLSLIPGSVGAAPCPKHRRVWCELVRLSGRGRGL